MPDYVCVIQEGQAADGERAALARGLARIGQQAFGDDPSAVEIDWRPVAKDYAWTAGEPSRASLIIRSVPVGLPPDKREAFMHEVTALWERVTGCSVDDVVVTAWDGPLPI